MNVINYINKYGDTSLEEKDITEIDKLIFGLLSYVPFNGTVSNSRKNRRTIHDVGVSFFDENNKDCIKKNIMAIRNAINLLSLIMNKKRYKDLLIYNYAYIADEKQQFSATTIEINSKLVYVSFEGTDHMISGWEEDCRMSYEFPVDAQTAAINYLNKKFTFSSKKIIVGGHSKGGNLALVASMYANFIVRRNIINVYSYDGPGLRKEQISSKYYKKIADKFIHIIPNYSIAGLLLMHTNDYVVIKSNKIGLTAHSAESWQINDDNFIFDSLSTSSKILEQGMQTWLDKYDDIQRREFVEQVFDMFRRTNIKSLVQIIEDPRLLFKILRDTTNVDSIVRTMIKELGNILVDYSKQTISNMFGDNK